MLAHMASEPVYQPITADDFLEMDFKSDRKFELSNGVIRMMTGGSEPHAWVQGNILTWLRTRLRGSGCFPYGSEMGVRLSEVDVRYPDVSVRCAPRPQNGLGVRALDAPTLVIEVLSPSTANFDQGAKLQEYQSIASIELVAFVDPESEQVRTLRRLDHLDWTDSKFAAVDLDLTPLGLVMPHAEIFARD